MTNRRLIIALAVGFFIEQALAVIAPRIDFLFPVLITYAAFVSGLNTGRLAIIAGFVLVYGMFWGIPLWACVLTGGVICAIGFMLQHFVILHRGPLLYTIVLVSCVIEFETLRYVFR